MYGVGILAYRYALHWDRQGGYRDLDCSGHNPPTMTYTCRDNACAAQVACSSMRRRRSVECASLLPSAYQDIYSYGRIQYSLEYMDILPISAQCVSIEVLRTLSFCCMDKQYEGCICLRPRATEVQGTAPRTCDPGRIIPY